MLKCALFIIFLSLAACKDASDKKDKQPMEEVNSETTNEKEVINDKLCFQNDYVYNDDKSMKDFLKLVLNIDDQKVLGTYDWLPAEKDQRKGKLIGILEKDLVTADYIFSQEGVIDTVEVKIIISPEEAKISGGNAELGLSASLRKVDCKK